MPVLTVTQNQPITKQKQQTISALPPRGYMISGGSFVRDLNYDLPEDASTEWTEHEEHIFRAIMLETGWPRYLAICAYRRGDPISKRRLCRDTSGGEWHFLPEGIRANGMYCDSECARASKA
jgi:hypothetical protein